MASKIENALVDRIYECGYKTIEECAKKAEIHPDTIYRILRGDHQVRKGTWNKLGLALNLSVSEVKKLAYGKGAKKGLDEEERERYEKQIAMYERHIERLEKELDRRLNPMKDADVSVGKRNPDEG